MSDDTSNTTGRQSQCPETVNFQSYVGEVKVNAAYVAYLAVRAELSLTDDTTPQETSIQELLGFCRDIIAEGPPCILFLGNALDSCRLGAEAIRVSDEVLRLKGRFCEERAQYLQSLCYWLRRFADRLSVSVREIRHRQDMITRRQWTGEHENIYRERHWKLESVMQRYHSVPPHSFGSHVQRPNEGHTEQDLVMTNYADITEPLEAELVKIGKYLTRMTMKLAARLDQDLG